MATLTTLFQSHFIVLSDQRVLLLCENFCWILVFCPWDEVSLSPTDRHNNTWDYTEYRWAVTSQYVACLRRRCDKDIKVSYTVYNRLSVLLKSLLAITRVTPAYKLSRKQGHDYVILYRWADCSDTSCDLVRVKHVWQVSPSVSASLVSRIYFGEVQLSALGEGNCELCFLTSFLL